MAGETVSLSSAKSRGRSSSAVGDVLMKPRRSEFISGVNGFCNSRNLARDVVQVIVRRFELSDLLSAIVEGSRSYSLRPHALSCSRVSHYVRIIGIIPRVGSRLRFPADRYGTYV